MRSLSLPIASLSLLCVLLVGAALVRADEPPEAPVKPGAETATPGDAPEETAPSAAPLDPKQAYVRVTQAANGLPRAQWMPARRKAAQDFLAKWDAANQTVGGEALLFLGRLQQTAERYVDSAASFQGVLAAETVPEGIRAQAAGGAAALLSSTKARAALTQAEKCAACATSVTGFLAATTSPATESLRATAHRTMARYYGAVQETDAAVTHEMRAAVLNPTLAASSARSVLKHLMGSTHSMEGYAPLKAGANAVLATLGALAQKQLEQAKLSYAALKQEGAPENRLRNAERAMKSAESAVKLQDRYARPFELLGQVAPKWTLEHSFGTLKNLDELKGQVVVLDFWATWCPWCIKSFPAIRDVLTDYKGKGLTFVGVTATASTVYEARYDLDDDLKDKATPGERAKPAARMTRGNQEPDPENGIFGPDAFKKREIEVIETFIANHKMDWPVVMIDKTEPGPKYALMGWPHAVVIDKQGRIRYFKSGALLRDRPEDVKKFRQILDDLLAE